MDANAQTGQSWAGVTTPWLVTRLQEAGKELCELFGYDENTGVAQRQAGGGRKGATRSPFIDDQAKEIGMWSEEEDDVEDEVAGTRSEEPGHGGGGGGGDGEGGQGAARAAAGAAAATGGAGSAGVRPPYRILFNKKTEEAVARLPIPLKSFQSFVMQANTLGGAPTELAAKILKKSGGNKPQFICCDLPWGVLFNKKGNTCPEYDDSFLKNGEHDQAQYDQFAELLGNLLAEKGSSVFIMCGWQQVNKPYELIWIHISRVKKGW